MLFSSSSNISCVTPNSDRSGICFSMESPRLPTRLDYSTPTRLSERPQALPHLLSNACQRHARLLERITVAQGDGLILQRLPIDGETVRRADLILPRIPAAD